MFRSIGIAVLFSLLLSSEGSAVTVYYQPTPYPFYMRNGTPMPQDVEKIHAWEGWTNSGYYNGQTLSRQSTFLIGGAGDQYRSYVKFDLTIPNVKIP